MFTEQMQKEFYELIEFLRSDDHNTRITFGDRWLVGSSLGWSVYQHKYGQKKTRALYEGTSLHDALTALRGEE